MLKQGPTPGVALHEDLYVDDLSAHFALTIFPCSRFVTCFATTCVG